MPRKQGFQSKNILRPPHSKPQKRPETVPDLILARSTPPELNEAAENSKRAYFGPSNRLEVLRGNRKGQHSIRINQQWRICFRWRSGDAYDVEIVDYH
jgi:Txe/YoeB family toxin of Txe-Axe toxin-antitoxin module